MQGNTLFFVCRFIIFCTSLRGAIGDVVIY